MGGEGAGKILALSSMFPFLKFASIFAFYFHCLELLLLPWAFLRGRGLSSLNLIKYEELRPDSDAELFKSRTKEQFGV